MRDYSEKEKIYLEKDMWMVNLVNFENFSVDYLEIEDKAVEDHVIHSDCDEWLYIVEGTLEVYVGDKRFTLGTNDFVEVPKNTVHGSINKSGKVVKMLSVCSPPFKLEYMKKCLDEIKQ